MKPLTETFENSLHESIIHNLNGNSGSINETSHLSNKKNTFYDHLNLKRYNKSFFLNRDFDSFFFGKKEIMTVNIFD